MTEQLPAKAIDPGALLIEPEGRNTAPAVLAANDPDGLILVIPSDHVVPDAAVGAGVPEAKAGNLVTFGITPDRAETGYGYLEPSGQPDGSTPIGLTRFVEEPDPTRAMIAAFEAHAPAGLCPRRI